MFARLIPHIMAFWSDSTSLIASKSTSYTSKSRWLPIENCFNTQRSEKSIYFEKSMMFLREKVSFSWIRMSLLRKVQQIPPSSRKTTHSRSCSWDRSIKKNAQPLPLGVMTGIVGFNWIIFDYLPCPL